MVITFNVWKKANIVPCVSHGVPFLTFLGGMWLPCNLPLGFEKDWAEVGKEGKDAAAVLGAQGASDVGQAQPWYEPESGPPWPRT